MTDDESVLFPKARLTKGNIEGKLDAVLDGVAFIEKYFRIEKEINEYGTFLREVYDDFITRVEDELRVLERREVVGREYVLRSSMLLFSLIMTRVYLGVVGPRDSLPLIDEYIKRAKRLS